MSQAKRKAEFEKWCRGSVADSPALVDEANEAYPHDPVRAWEYYIWLCARHGNAHAPS
jgi:hypothetical protein